MTPSRLLAGLALSALSAPLVAGSTSPSPFAANERWCALGDSITHSGTYSTWVLLYYVTRFPSQKIQEYNCGISGDVAAGALERLNWDVLEHRPTIVSIMLGMNDVDRPLYSKIPSTPENEAAKKAKIDSYEKNMTELVAKIQATGSKVILIQPSIFDETADINAARQAGVNEALGACSQFLAELARKTGATLVDFYDPMNAVTKKIQAADPAATIVGGDRIHPGPPGHFLMAYQFIEAQGLPAEVAHATIDAGAGNVVDAGNSTISDLKKADSGVSFTWDEHALPYPIDPACTPALAWMPFVENADQEILAVKGLAPSSSYQLSVDGIRICTYSGDELARGVNLATETRTPQYQQAAAVSTLIQARGAMIGEKLRGIAMIEHKAATKIAHPVTAETMAPYLQAWVTKMGPHVNGYYKEAMTDYVAWKHEEPQLFVQADADLAKAYALAAPKPHAYTIVRVP